MATLRRESNTALAATATEQRDTIREITAQIAPNPDIIVQELREETRPSLERHREVHRTASQILSDRIERLERGALIMQARVEAVEIGNAVPRETGARPRTR